MPGTLGGAMDALERDHEFLLRGDVFTTDLIDSWIDFKRSNDLTELNLRPTPLEFELYYDV